MRIKRRTITLLLIIVGHLAAGAVLLLGRETALSRALRISTALDGVPDARAMTIPEGQPAIVEEISWFATPGTTPTPGPVIRIAPPKREATVVAAGVNLRAGPSAEHRIIGQAEQGDQLEILGRTQAGDWLKVTTAGSEEAWVHAELVSTSVQPSEIPVIEAAPPPPAVQ